MPNGRGAGFGSRGGMGFGFRGSSPPWPYVGIGRGGLPRCGYFLGGAAGVPAAQAYQGSPYQAGPGFVTWQSPYPVYPEAQQMSREQELDFLRNQAEAINEQLKQIESRIQGLEGESKS